MASIPAKVSKRISDGLKRFQPIVDSARARDINESDTVTIVTDVLQYVLGYDKYSEITSEHEIRGTYCDLALKLDGELTLLIEVKAIGLELKDQYIKQAVDYAANQGVEWVVLTNGHFWRVYSVSFTKPIAHELIVEFDICAINHKKEQEFEPLFVLSKEGWKKSRIEEYRSQKQALDKFTLAATLLDPDVLQIIRRELRRVSPDAKIDVDEIERVLSQEVIKREVLDGEKAESAKKLVRRSSKRALKVAKGEKEEAAAPNPPSQANVSR